MARAILSRLWRVRWRRIAGMVATDSDLFDAGLTPTILISGSFGKSVNFDPD
jgi:hypothetical protein